MSLFAAISNILNSIIIVSIKIIITFLIVIISINQLKSQDFYYAAIPGDTVILTLQDSVSGDIQWQERDDEFDVWKDIPSATINHFNVLAKNTITNRKIYRAKILKTGENCYSHSSEIKQHIVQKVSDIPVGDFYTGGLVFYKKDSMGLVVAPYNSIEPLYGDQGFAPWGCSGTSIPGADSTGIGYGRANTQDILNACKEPGTAAYMCDTLKLNGFDDWFLPSLDELSILFNIQINEKIAFFNTKNNNQSLDTHWSSSEHNTNLSWGVAGVTFSGQPNSVMPGKNKELRVRAVRQFIRTNGLKFECFTKILKPTLQYSIAVKKIDSIPSDVIVKFVGDGNDTDRYSWNFGQGIIISGTGRGPYQIRYNYGGENKITVRNLSNKCDSSVYYSEYFRVKLFQNIMPNFPDIYPGSFSWGDYNNDNFLDVLITGSNYSRIAKNMGVDSFKIIPLDLPKLSYSYCDWGDFNNDNLLDFAICGYKESDSLCITRVFQNFGNDSFTEVNFNFAGVKNGFVKWFDRNNDGLIELLVSGEDNNRKALTKVYTNFKAIQINELPTSIINLKNSNGKFGDYDKDGYNDLLITGIDSGKRYSIIYRNDSGVFKDSKFQITGVDNGSVDWGDYDNNGELDFAISGAQDSTIIYRDDDKLSVNYSLAVYSRIFKNMGKNNFKSSLLVDEYLQFAFSSLAWGDYDNDGDLDLIITGVPKMNYSKLSGGNGKYLIQTYPSLPTLLRNDSNDIFKNAYVPIPDFTEYITHLDSFFHLTDDGFQSSYISFGDYNQDGKLDILRNGSGDMSSIYKNVTHSINLPPHSPENLISIPTCEKVKLTWDNAIDDHTPPQSILYEIYVGSSPGKCDILSKANIYKIRNTEFTLHSLKPGTYYWSVKAVDQAQSASGYAREQTFTISSKPATPIINLNANELHSDAKDGNQWYNQNGPIAGAINQNFTPSATGDYYTIVSLNGCSSEPSNIIHIVISNTVAPDLNSLIRTFPNPVRNELIIDASGFLQDIGFEMINAIGQRIYIDTFKERTKISTSNFVNGLYFIRFDINNHIIYKKMLKE